MEKAGAELDRFSNTICLAGSNALAKNKFTYFCYGFRIVSDIYISELKSAVDPRPTVFDLSVEIAQTQGAEFESLAMGYNLTQPNTISFHLPGLVTFVIEDGQRIRVFQNPDTDPEHIRAYLLGSGIGAAMHQRGIVPLHASSVRRAQGAIAFSAPRGFGKSTIAAGLWQRGFDMLSDDILALKENARGQIACLRGAPGLKLLPDAASRLDINGATPKEMNDITGKYFVSIDPASDSDELPLWRMYFLREGSQIRMRRLAGPESMAHVVSNIYRPELIGLLNAQRRLLPQMASVVSAASSFALERPPGCDVVELIGAIERHIAECG
jgi:hypothetical protein